MSRPPTLPRQSTATAGDQHGVDAQLFRVGNLRLERRGAEIRIHPHHVRAQFGHDGLGVGDQRFIVVERDDAHLVRRKPEREVARVMLDEEADETLMRAERRRFQPRGFLDRATANFRNSLAARPGGRCLGQTATILRSGFGDCSER